MRKSAAGFATLVVIGTLAAGGPARSEESESGISLDIATGVRWLELPDVQAGLDNPSSPDGATRDAVGAGLDTTLGFSLASPLAGFGDGARVLARTRFVWADAKDTTGAGAYGQMPVDGSGSSDGGGANEATSKLDYDRYDLDLVYQVGLSGDSSLRTLARVGPSYAHVGHELEFFSAPFNGFRIDDEITTNYYGAVLGLGLATDLPWGLELAADLDVDLLAADSELDVRQNFGGFPIRVGDDENHFAARIRPTLGATYKLGLETGFFDAMVVGLRTSAEWSSYLPTVEHAVDDSNPFPSRLDHDDAVSIGGDATLRFLF